MFWDIIILCLGVFHFIVFIVMAVECFFDYEHSNHAAIIVAKALDAEEQKPEYGPPILTGIVSACAFFTFLMCCMWFDTRNIIYDFIIQILTP